MEEREQKDLAVTNQQEINVSKLERLAEYLIRSRFFNIQSKEQLITLMLFSQAMGKHPVQALMEYDIIQGRPYLKTQVLLARFLRAGGKIIWKRLDDEIAEAEFEFQGSKVSVVWTIEKARQLGLVRPNSSWERYPRAMLRNRVIREGIQAICPQAFYED